MNKRDKRFLVTVCTLLATLAATLWAAALLCGCGDDSGAVMAAPVAEEAEPEEVTFTLNPWECLKIGDQSIMFPHTWIGDKRTRWLAFENECEFAIDVATVDMTGYYEGESLSFAFGGFTETVNAGEKGWVAFIFAPKTFATPNGDRRAVATVRLTAHASNHAAPAIDITVDLEGPASEPTEPTPVIHTFTSLFDHSLEYEVQTDSEIAIGQTLYFDASWSVSETSQIAQYKWVLVGPQHPAGAGAHFSPNNTAEQPHVTPDRCGHYTVWLYVADHFKWSIAPAEFTFSVPCL